jgi:hypothetical protein
VIQIISKNLKIVEIFRGLKCTVQLLVWEIRFWERSRNEETRFKSPVKLVTLLSFIFVHRFVIVDK